MGRNERDKAAMADASDAALIASSEADAASFGVVFDRHVDQIYAYVVRRVGITLAEELTAETFAKAFEQRARFVPIR